MTTDKSELKILFELKLCFIMVETIFANFEKIVTIIEFSLYYRPGIVDRPSHKPCLRILEWHFYHEFTYSIGLC